MKCPKCGFMFAFRIDEPVNEDPQQIQMDFTAPVEDSEAFDKFVQTLQDAAVSSSVEHIDQLPLAENVLNTEGESR